MSTESPNSATKVKGSCACGKIKFTAEPNLGAMCYCYCTTCRKCSGAPYLPFIECRKDDVHWESPPTQWHKSDSATRGHCSTCGSCIYMIYDSQPDQIWIVAGCIDEGVKLVKPVSECIFVAEKPAWAALPKDVKCFDEFPPSSS